MKHLHFVFFSSPFWLHCLFHTLWYIELAGFLHCFNNIFLLFQEIMHLYFFSPCILFPHTVVVWHVRLANITTQRGDEALMPFLVTLHLKWVVQLSGPFLLYKMLGRTWVLQVLGPQSLKTYSYCITNLQDQGSASGLQNTWQRKATWP